MSEGQGAAMALPIYGLYMQKVYADESLPYSQEEKFDIPEDFDPCRSIFQTGGNEAADTSNEDVVTDDVSEETEEVEEEVQEGFDDLFDW